MIELRTALHGKHTEKTSKCWDNCPAGIDFQIMIECGINLETVPPETLEMLTRVSRTARHYGYYAGTRAMAYRYGKQAKKETA